MIADSPSAVIFGAGSVGRGFLGQLFTESGYGTVFVDVDETLVAAMARRGAYTLRLAGIDKVADHVIGPIRAVSGHDIDWVANEVCQASLVATAVGARALQAIAAPIAQGLARRWRAGDARPLNIIICENLHDAPLRLRGFVEDALTEEDRALVASRVGFVPAVIARMAPVPTRAQRAADVTFMVAEPYKVLPVDRDACVGDVPKVVGLYAVAPFEAYTARKLFIHNAAHAMLGYLGYQRGCAYGYEALDDPWVRVRLDEALDESSRALVVAYGLEPIVLQEHIAYLLLRFGNRALADPVSRLARDPLRKLAPEDRLVGAARLAERHGIVPKGLAWGIAGGLAYRDLEDPHSVALQTRIASDGVARALEEVSGIAAEETLGRLALTRYAQLISDESGSVMVDARAGE
jgi:mannitol-1-phosphate 5-dehydrogenase